MKADLCSAQPFSRFSLSVLGKVLSAVGSAQLLMSQKFQQFRGLCEQNLVSVLLPPPQWELPAGLASKPLTSSLTWRRSASSATGRVRVAHVRAYKKRAGSGPFGSLMPSEIEK